MIQDKIHHLTAAEKEIVKNLYRIQVGSKDSDRALSLFRHYDRDNSGDIDKNGSQKMFLAPTNTDRVYRPAEGSRDGAWQETN